MNSKNESKKIAKLIFQSSQVSGKIDENKLAKILKIIESYRSVQAKMILTNLVKILEKNDNENRLQVESAFDLSTQEETEIKNTFEKKLSKDLKLKVNENKTLVGGIRVSNGDWVWEDSIVSKLTQLKGNFINE